MVDLHQLVLEHGKAGAKLLSNQEDWPLIDAAAAVLAEESEALGITYSGFCMAGLPHRKIPTTEKWVRQSADGKLRMVIEPGEMQIGRKTELFGVPYGSRARLIMLYLQTKAVQSRSREIELGGSLTAWMRRMGMGTGGMDFAMVRDQQNRIMACRLSFFYGDGDSVHFDKDNIIKRGILLRGRDEPGGPPSGQGELWAERVLLGETFFAQLMEHPVPVLEPAIREISGESMTMDVYIWLAYRLHSLRKPTVVTWPALYTQFGAGYARLFHFKPRFLSALKMALAVYPGAVVDISDTSRGVVLHPSRPPIDATKLRLVTA